MARRAPRRATGRASRPVQVRRVLDEARAVMGAALVQGGTSFDALYVNVNGQSGYFDRSLHAYGREGEALRPLRHPDPPGGVHEPLVVLLPTLPARPASPPDPPARLTERASGVTLEDGRRDQAGPPRRKACIHGQGSDGPSPARPRPPRFGWPPRTVSSASGSASSKSLVTRLMEENDRLAVARRRACSTSSPSTWRCSPPDPGPGNASAHRPHQSAIPSARVDLLRPRRVVTPTADALTTDVDEGATWGARG